MNNTARADDWMIRNGDWISHAYSPIEEADRSVGSELKNDILPMFSFELDEPPDHATTKARWGELTREDYELLCPTLRLASQLLQSPPSSDAICSITYGDRHPSPDRIVRHGAIVQEFHKHTIAPANVRETAGMVLQRLGRSTRFKLTNMRNDPNDDRDANGHTYGMTGGFPQGVAVADGQLRRGIASMTKLDEKYLKMLKELLVETLGKQFQILKLNFEMAITICHEVIHAIHLALGSGPVSLYLEQGDDRKPQIFIEPFCEGQTVAELGYFWEDHVFGGACIQSMPHRAYPVYVAEWPSWIFRDKDEQPERALPKRRALKWLVSAYYVKNIQTQEFWNMIDVQYPHDLLALRIRKRVAVKCLLPPNLMDYDETWDPDAPENKLGKSTRVPFTDDDPSPGARLANETPKEKEERLDRERQTSSPG